MSGKDRRRCLVLSYSDHPGIYFDILINFEPASLKTFRIVGKCGNIELTSYTFWEDMDIDYKDLYGKGFLELWEKYCDHE